MLATNCYREPSITASTTPFSNRVLVSYYLATALFLLLDYSAGLNIRIAFLQPYPAARLAYYGVCFVCLGLMLWRPASTVLISAFESMVTLSALIISMGMRTLLQTDRALETGTGLVTVPEVFNFLFSGGIAYLAWARGINRLRNISSR